jgi:hypothetical protein
VKQNNPFQSQNFVLLYLMPAYMVAEMEPDIWLGGGQTKNKLKYVVKV